MSTSAHEAGSVLLSSAETLALSGTIDKYGSRRVVVIDVAATGAAAAGFDPALRVAVNGYPPTSGDSVVTSCGLSAGSPCTLNGLFVVDLDAAASQFPGAFRGEPLFIDVYTLRLDGGVSPVILDVTLSARVMRK